MSTATTTGHWISPPLKTHGGKGGHHGKLARWIVSLMPRHLCYTEPFAGGLAVLLARDPDDPRFFVGDKAHQRGASEVANDLNGPLINFWRVLQDEAAFQRFRRTVEAVPLARQEWEKAHAHPYGADPVADAVAFFVDCRQSLAGRMKGFTSLTRTRTRRGMNGNVSEWLTAVDGLADVHARLRRVGLENMPALDFIRREDTPDTLHYCDPPYLHQTRTAKNVYAYEMSAADHGQLLDVLLACRGKVMLSGYPSALYDSVLTGWSRHTFDVPNNASGAKKKGREIETLWCNF
jgi:DNA adenine methylase